MDNRIAITKEKFERLEEVESRYNYLIKRLGNFIEEDYCWCCWNRKKCDKNPYTMEFNFSKEYFLEEYKKSVEEDSSKQLIKILLSKTNYNIEDIESCFQLIFVEDYYYNYDKKVRFQYPYIAKHLDIEFDELEQACFDEKNKFLRIHYTAVSLQTKKRTK